MKIVLKQTQQDDSYYFAEPEGHVRNAFKEAYIAVLRDDNSLSSVEPIVNAMADLCVKEQIIMCFPNPPEGGWKHDAHDEETIMAALRMIRIGADRVANGGWHTMNDSQYLVGEGSGASLVNTIAARYPAGIAAVLTLGGEFSPDTAEASVNAPMPAMLVNPSESTRNFYVCINRAMKQSEKGNDNIFVSLVNPVQKVIEIQGGPSSLTPELIRRAWTELFRVTRRPNMSVYGDLTDRLDLASYPFEIHLDDNCLGDNGGIGHTWFEAVPEYIKEHPDKKVPLMVYCHGGSDNPGEAADMARFFEIGEEEGFVTVYPWSSNKMNWNMDMNKGKMDDMAYIEALIKYLVQKHPIDESRIYASGFSNGSAMMMSFAMTHPQTIAGLCPMNTRWPQDREVLSFHIANAKKLEYDYRMPIWYYYGGRDFEAPAYRGSGQQIASDFWKAYNNIKREEWPYHGQPNPYGTGVKGQVVEEIFPSKTNPDRRYMAHRYFSEDDGGENYYNYVFIPTKGHEVGPEEARMGWDYVKHFRRNPDGSISRL
jgi:poly(3-hydroxybutyrate) depolymerase